MPGFQGIAAAALLLAGGVAAAAGPTPGAVARYSSAGKFDEVKEDVALAIQARGLVIEQTSHIHAMLQRTGKDLGTPRAIYREAQALSFCSAVVSRRMMEADPHAIALCPYVISVYVLHDEPQTVYVAYRRPTAGSEPSPTLQEVEQLLDGIAREALGLP